jgi:hypothetical protein
VRRRGSASGRDRNRVAGAREAAGGRERSAILAVRDEDPGYGWRGSTAGSLRRRTRRPIR